MSENDVEELADQITATPLDELLGLPRTPRERYDHLVEAEQRYIELLNSCMADEGFDHEEQPSGFSLEEIVVAENQKSASGAGDSGSIRESGYGVSQSLDMNVALALGEIPGQDGSRTDSDEYFESLSEEEQAAFAETYNTCSQDAYDESPVKIGADIPDQILAELDELHDDWSGSPGAVALRDAWIACMDNDGYPYGSRSEIVTYLVEKSAPITTQLRERGEMSPETETAIDELEAEEMTIAQADADCADEVGLDDGLQEIGGPSNTIGWRPTRIGWRCSSRRRRPRGREAVPSRCVPRPRATYRAAMSRLPAPPADDLNDEQRAVWNAVTNGRRGDPARLVGPDGGLVGPFNAAVVAPRTGRAVVALGEALRFDSGLDRRLLELAVCTVGAHWRADFEWWAHRRLAAAAGVSDRVLDALERGDDPALDADDEQAVYDLTRSLLTTGRVDPTTYGAAHTHLGDVGLVELVQLVGYYTLVSFTLNAFEVELPASGEPHWPYRWD